MVDVTQLGGGAERESKANLSIYTERINTDKGYF